MTFVLNGLYSAYIFGVASAYNLQIFGVDNFGKLMGVFYMATGILGLLQLPAASMLVSSGSFFGFNVAMAGCIFVCFAFPWWLRRQQIAAGSTLGHVSDTTHLLDAGFGL